MHSWGSLRSEGAPRCEMKPKLWILKWFYSILSIVRKILTRTASSTPYPVHYWTMQWSMLGRCNGRYDGRFNGTVNSQPQSQKRKARTRSQTAKPDRTAAPLEFPLARYVACFLVIAIQSHRDEK